MKSYEIRVGPQSNGLLRRPLGDSQRGKPLKTEAEPGGRQPHPQELQGLRAAKRSGKKQGRMLP